MYIIQTAYQSSLYGTFSEFHGQRYQSATGGHTGVPWTQNDFSGDSKSTAVKKWAHVFICKNEYECLLPSKKAI